MPNYTKLFNSIVTSTIWTEDDKTRIVWVTMLALADQHGEVHASIPGLARLANVPVENVEKAIQCFLSPDKYSRTKDAEGRRIEEIDGGWALLNYAKYRRLASKEDSKEANARRQKRHRERNATVTPRNATVTPRNATVTPRNATVTPERDIAEAEAEAEAEKETPKPPKGGLSGLSLDLWEAAPPNGRMRSSKKQVAAAIKKAHRRPDDDEIVSVFRQWCKSDAWTKDAGAYVPALHRWINNRGWESPPEQTNGYTPRPVTTRL